jgi:site-specific recombinase XerD
LGRGFEPRPPYEVPLTSAYTKLTEDRSSAQRSYRGVSLPCMPTPQAPSPEPLAAFLDDWRVHLRAKNRAFGTIESYLAAGRAFCDFLAANGFDDGHSEITRSTLERYFADMNERVKPATTAKPYRSLQQLFRWLVSDGKLERSPMDTMSPPSVPEQPVPVLDLDEIAKLLASCGGNTFENRRDTAILRLFLDTGMRAGELIGLLLADLEYEQSVAFVMGKGGRGRACPSGPEVGAHTRRHRAGWRRPKAYRFAVRNRRRKACRRAVRNSAGLRTGRGVHHY